jgi:flagellar basal-body rod modification protein FlgD
MTRIPSIGTSPATSTAARSQSDAFRGVDIDHFLKLMIAELQNQDPLNPLDNSQMLQQVSQIREIGATEQLTQTLETVLLRQNIATATGLLGQQIQGLTARGEPAQGTVQHVSIVDGQPQLHIDGATTAAPDASPGFLKEGTYRYKVVFGRDTDGKALAIELGPVETTGTPGVDQAMLLANLPVTQGPKDIYRTDASGNGDYHFVAHVDGQIVEFVDVLRDADLPGGVLTTETIPDPGRREYVVGLNGIQRIQSSDERRAVSDE